MIPIPSCICYYRWKPIYDFLYNVISLSAQMNNYDGISEIHVEYIKDLLWHGIYDKSDVNNSFGLDGICFLGYSCEILNRYFYLFIIYSCLLFQNCCFFGHHFLSLFLDCLCFSLQRHSKLFYKKC